METKSVGSSKLQTEMTQSLLDMVFTKLNEIENKKADSGLFSEGVATLDLKVEIRETPSSQFCMTLKIAGKQSIKPMLPGFPISEADEFGVSFNSNGHHIVALIAMRDLETSSQQAAQMVNEILGAVGRSVLGAATFPDEIRNQQPQTKPFHFIDIPFKENDNSTPLLPNPPHVLSKIDEFTTFLKDGNGIPQEKADALSWLFHLFGDAHQPLHCIEHISELHPGGDRGGNSFKVKGKAKNLHSAWDGSVNVFHPGKDEDELANEIIQGHSRASLATMLAITDPEQWARASFQVAKEHAYTIEENPQNPPQLSETYLQNMEKIGQIQAALAGYRLSDRLREIFG